MNESPRKPAILICTCSGTCPSMVNIDFWALSERIRIEYEDRIEFMALHPRLCEADGERLMKQLVTGDMLFITPACAEKRQEKLLRDGFAAAGVPMDAAHWIPVSMAKEDTDRVFDKIRALLEPQPVAATS